MPTYIHNRYQSPYNYNFYATTGEKDIYNLVTFTIMLKVMDQLFMVGASLKSLKGRLKFLKIVNMIFALDSGILDYVHSSAIID